MTSNDNQNQSEKIPPMWVFITFWLLIISMSYFWSVHSEKAYFFNLARQRGEMVFEVVMTTRKWNANHGSVYVPLTEESPANPYLDVKDKVITAPSGESLTLINPAYMTRQISDIMSNQALNINLASLNPLNPHNAPNEWERTALEAFEKGDTSRVSIIYTDTGSQLNYMKPLHVTQDCLTCHAKQGYKVGEVRGGLRVTFPYNGAQSTVMKEIFLFHLLSFIIANIATYLFVKKTNTLISRLKQERQSRDKVIHEKTRVLKEIATTDALTGIRNRHALNLYVEKRLNRAKQSCESFSYILIDLDHFKHINDSYGHDVGDLVLKSVVDTIRQNIRQENFFARYGGEEFVIIMPGTDKNEAYIVVERIRKIVENHQIDIADKHKIKITISFGVTDFDSSEDIFHAADRAMYTAKTEGRNRGVIYQKDVEDLSPLAPENS